MGVHRAADIERRFASYIEGLVSVIGHRDRAGPLCDYCVGLVMPGARKSVEPMAALTAPERTAAQHQSLLHFVGQGPWSDEKVLAKVREMVLPRRKILIDSEPAVACVCLAPDHEGAKARTNGYRHALPGYVFAWRRGMVRSRPKNGC